MTIYLLRHGIAEDQPPGGSDSERKLTQQGTLRTAMVAKGLRRLDISFDRIISSPYVRARETAEIVGRITGYDGEIGYDNRLVPFGNFLGVSDLIGENDDAEHLLIAGHQPSMGEFISGLCAAGHLAIEVKKASITAVQITRVRPRASGILLWSMTPKLFEKLTSG